MAARHTGWLRARGDADLVYSEGRKLLGYLMEDLARTGLRQGKVQKWLEDGTLLIARFDGTTPIIEVHTAEPAQPDTSASIATVWKPHGFVLYPSGETSVSGWGMPPIISGDPWDNLDVPTDSTNWTAGGKLGEVLLTDRVQAGYPDRKLTLLPLLAAITDAPLGVVVQPNVPGRDPDGWTGYRPAFADFLVRNTPVSDAVRRALFTQANARRVTDGHAALILPLRGYFDEGQFTAGLVAQFGITAAPGTIEDATLGATAPAGYKAATQRLARDGVLEHAHDITTTHLDPGQLLMDAWAGAGLDDTDFDTAAQLGSGTANGVFIASLQRRGQWIGYGNQFWMPGPRALPILSWNGLPAINLTLAATAGSPFGPTSVDYITLDADASRVRGASRKWFSDALFANGRQIGKLPGLVIGAGARAIPREENQPQKYRLIVLCWHAADHTVTDGCYVAFAHFRVWFADMVDDGPFGPRLLAPAIGEYDATTNPSGWHFAGTFDTPQFNPVVCQLFNFFLFQPWRFSRSGTRAVSVISSHLVNSVLSFRGSVEIVFGDVNDGVLVATVSFPDQPLDPTNGTTNLAPIFAADYDDNDNLVYVLQHGFGEWTAAQDPLKWPPGTDTAVPTLTWQGIELFAVDTGSISPAAFYLSTTAFHILDVVDGVIVFLDAYPNCYSGTHKFRVRVFVKGVVVHTAEYDDPARFVSDTTGEAVRPGMLLTSYARDRDGNRVIAYELEGKQAEIFHLTRARAGGELCEDYLPAAEESLPADTFVGSWADIAGPNNTFIGDLTTMLGVPSAQLRVFPVGVI